MINQKKEIVKDQVMMEVLCSKGLNSKLALFFTFNFF